jgi:hypothetical protein
MFAGHWWVSPVGAAHLPDVALAALSGFQIWTVCPFVRCGSGGLDARFGGAWSPYSAVLTALDADVAIWLATLATPGLSERSVRVASR